MNEFLRILQRTLGSLSPQQKQEILDDYREHFRLGLEAGKTEKQIAEALGDPEQLGRMYAVAAASRRAHKSRGLRDMMRLIGAAISYKAGGGILIGTIYFTCLTGLIVLCCTAAALVAGGLGLLVLVAYELAAAYLAYGLMAFFAALTLGAGGLLLFKGSFKLWRCTFSRLPLLARKVMWLKEREETL